MNYTFRLTFDIQCGADPADLLDRLIEFQQQLVNELEEEKDVFGEPMPNRGDEGTCSVEHKKSTVDPWINESETLINKLSKGGE
jgi:hypothetical protein